MTDRSLEELGDLSDLNDGQMRCFEHVGPHGMLVCRVEGELFALDDNCSHADTPLSEGRLRGHSVMCPLHGAGFDVRTGEHSGPPAFTGVETHPVSVRADGVAVVSVSTHSLPDPNAEPQMPSPNAEPQCRAPMPSPKCRAPNAEPQMPSKEYSCDNVPHHDL